MASSLAADDDANEDDGRARPRRRQTTTTGATEDDLDDGDIRCDENDEEASTTRTRVTIVNETEATETSGGERERAEDGDENERERRAELARAMENIRALEIAQKQALEAGERAAKQLRLKLEHASVELVELKRREAVHAATAHAANEAAQRAARFEVELASAKMKLADAETALADSANAVKALQFQIDVGHDATGDRDANAFALSRAHMDLADARARAARAEEMNERLRSDASALRAEIDAFRRSTARLSEEHVALVKRADDAEKQLEINALIGGSSGVKPEDLIRLQSASNKVDVVVAENLRLASERDALKAALSTCEDSVTSLKTSSSRDREEFEAWKKKARDLIDSRDREIDRMRSRDKADADKSTAVRESPPSQRRDETTYLKTIVLQFFSTEEWEVQQSLLPTVVRLCGGDAADLDRIKRIHAQFEPTVFNHGATAMTQSANAVTESLGFGRLF